MSNRRKNYFIKKDFQIGFVKRFIALVLVEGFVIGLIFTFTAGGTWTTAYDKTGVVIENSVAFFLANFLIITIVSTVIVSLMGVIIFIVFSHSIGGPLYKIENILDNAARGDFSKRAVLRKSDQLLKLMDSANNLIVSTEREIIELKKKIDYCLNDMDRTEIDSLVSLRNKLKDIKSSLNHFKTSDEDA